MARLYTDRMGLAESLGLHVSAKENAPRALRDSAECCGVYVRVQRSVIGYKVSLEQLARADSEYRIRIQCRLTVVSNVTTIKKQR
jgi:hypothetical protein